MAKFLIEVPHDATEEACVQAVKIFLETGSHFLTNADWGCQDGDHNAYMLVEVDTKEEARRILPAAYKSEARIIELHKYTREEMKQYMYH
jgi:hypothetical protein